MSPRNSKPPAVCRRARAGFTLLEVMTATLVIALLTFALYRFVRTTLRALEESTELSEERQSVAALTRMLQAQLNELPPHSQGALTGKANKFKNLPSDEMTWLCRAGQGVMTGAAPGEYRVTLTVQPAEDNAAELELGLRRQPAVSEEKADVDFFKRGAATNRYNWLPLLRPAAALEIRYWDGRLNALLQQWNDPNALPSYVQVRIWKDADAVPVDAILAVPSANLQP